jgi:hypothetical protein
MPEWWVMWMPPHPGGTGRGAYKVPAHRAWDAWAQVKGAPAFGSCRVVRVKGEE